MRNTSTQAPRKIIGHTQSILVIVAALFIVLGATLWIGFLLTGQNIVVFSIFLLHIFLTLCPECLR